MKQQQSNLHRGRMNHGVLMVLTMRMNPLVKKSNGIVITHDRFAFGVATIPNFMAATSEDIVKMLRHRE